MTILQILPLTLLILGSVGCSNDNHKWVGTWKGSNTDLVNEEVAKLDPVTAESLRLVILKINPDSTFMLSRAGFPTTGTFIFGSQKSTLKIEKILDQPIERANQSTKNQNPNITVEWVDKDTIRLVDPEDFGRPPVILTKERNP